MGIWKDLKSSDQLRAIIDGSHRKPVVIYKHSSRCGTSFFVRKRLEHDWDFAVEDIDLYFLDLISYRDLSDEVAQTLGVRHESPQILVIADGRSIYDTSHGGVSVKAIKKALGSNGNGKDPS